MAGERTEFPRLPVLSSGTRATVAFASSPLATLTTTSLPLRISNSSSLPHISPSQPPGYSLKASLRPSRARQARVEQ